MLLGIAQFSTLRPSNIVGERTALQLGCYTATLHLISLLSMQREWPAGRRGSRGNFRRNSFETLGRQLIHPIEIADNHFQFQFWIFEEDIWPTQLEWLSQPDNDFLLTEIWSLTSDSDKKLDNSIYVVYQSTFKFESAPRQRRKFNLTTLKNGRCQFFLGSGMLSRGREILSAFLSPNWRPSNIL